MDALEPQEPQHYRRPQGVSRRKFLGLVGGVGVLGGAAYLIRRFAPYKSAVSTVAPAVARDRLDEFADNIRSGGPPKDGIPPIDEPKFLAARSADFLTDDDIVFGLVEGGEARAYPQLVLVWHEIVNDSLPDGPLSITYCPLTGSAVGFRGKAKGGEPLTFGTSGDLVNSNLLMYDRQSDSRWPQILGQAILGPSRGTQLQEVPVAWTTWGGWRTLHPETKVLSTETGHLRRYGDDPYGSYTPLAGYYEKGSRLFFPVMHEDHRFDRKEVVIGSKLGKARAAVRKDVLQDKKVAATELEGRPLTFLYDPRLDEARSYLSAVEGQEVVLVPADSPGEFRDQSSGSVFDSSGRALSGPLAGASLGRIVTFDVMWFAWAAFFPDTKVVE